MSGVFLVQSAALVVLLLSSLLIYRAFPQRYLLVWNGAWLAYLGHTAVGAYFGAEGPAGSILLIAAQALIAASLGFAAAQPAPFRWPLVVAGLACAGELIGFAAAPGLSGWFARAGYALLGFIALARLWHYGRRQTGAGPALLAAALLARLVHLPDLTSSSLRWQAVEAGSTVLALLAMLVLAVEAMRQHLRWSAAPGLIVSVAADYAAPGRLDKEAFQRIAQEIERVFEAVFSRFYLLPPGSPPPDEEAQFLIAGLPRSAAGRPAATVILPEKGAESQAWLRGRGLRWAVAVPILSPRVVSGPPSGLFVLGYRARRWVSPQLMGALVAIGRQFGVLLENSLLLQQISHVYRDWLNTVDAIGDLILVHDPQYRVQRLNRALAEKAGAAPAQMINRLCREVLPNSAGSPWENCPFCDLPQDGEKYDENLRGYFLVSTTRYPREDPSGILHVVKDISDRKQAEEKYRTMFETMHEGVFISSRDGRFLDVNEAFARMLGYQREELLKVTVASTYFRPGDREAYLREMDRQGYVSDYEVRLRRKTGEEIIALETSLGTRDEAGAITTLQGLVLDITARKRAEEQLHGHVSMLSAINRLGERLTGSLDQRDLLENAVREVRRIFGADTVAGYQVDEERMEATLLASDGFVTPGAAAVTALPVTRDFVAALRSDRRGVIALQELPEVTADVQAFRRAEGLRSTYVLPLRDEQILRGLTLTWRCGRPLTPAEENLLSAIGRQLNSALQTARLYEQVRSALDELRRTQEQLLHSEKMAALGQMISGVAHELNNPLTAIIGYSQLLGSEVSVRGSEYVEKLLRQAQRTHKIIQNLLSFARQSKPERQTLDLNRVIEDTLMLRDFEMQAGHVRLERLLAPGLPPVIGDVHQLEQVFLNIINNACDALRESGSGTLWVKTHREGEHVVAEFRDNGPGMKEPARVFDPFYTTKTVGRGTGLGLSICYGIIKEHGGDISAANNPDRGAAFRVRLPAGQPAAASTAAVAWD